MESFPNPFRPGAGHPPPYLAGREIEIKEFDELLQQKPILKNLLITGLRGVGKTVLLEALRPVATQYNFLWTGTDLSESASESEHTLSVRLLTDLATIVSSFSLKDENDKKIGYVQTDTIEPKLNFVTLVSVYNSIPGLEIDKLKGTLEYIWNNIKDHNVKGIVLAYDEAQILKDKAKEKQYPLSLLLEAIQFLQRKQIPYFLILTGLPTLVTTLSETRTYTERMFKILTLTRLDPEQTKQAIENPIKKGECPVTFSEFGIQEIIKYSDGYPYFIQFFCKETFDSVLQQINIDPGKMPLIIIGDFVRKLDADFYAGRWSRVTDRQRDLMTVIAKLPNANDEFTAKEISDLSTTELNNPFQPAYVNNTLVKLISLGLIFKNRRGKYSFAVPLLADYINRHENETMVSF